MVRNVQSHRTIPNSSQNLNSRILLKKNFQVKNEPSVQNREQEEMSPEQLYEQYQKKKTHLKKLQEKLKSYENDPKNITSRKQVLQMIQNESSSMIQ